MGTRLIDRTERLEMIERMLLQSTIGLRVVEIADHCGVDRRTIYRDLSLLSDIGVPIYQKDGRFYLNRQYYMAMIRLNFNEIISLYLAARLFAHNAAQQNPHTIAAISKLGTALPDKLARHVEYIVEILRKDPIDRAFVVVLETILRAWSDRRRVKLWYSADDSAHEFAIYFVEPTANGKVYAVGFDIKRRRVRALDLQHIKRVKTLSTGYDIPQQFEIKRHFASAWGDVPDEITEDKVLVKLRFSESVTPLISQRRMHPSQKIEFRDDKRCVVSFQLTDWKKLIPWIRSWGSEVEVLQPKAMRDEIAAESVRVAALYTTPAGS